MQSNVLNSSRTSTESPSTCPQALYVVGIGPGNPAHLSRRAREVLQEVTVVAGYTTYVDLIAPLVEGKEIIQTGMKKEVGRVAAAIDSAIGGRPCALVSSGDPGVYAMAGLVLEMCREKSLQAVPLADWQPGATSLKQGLFIEVVPGIPALCSGAALLGAPLTHDFAAVSLSDLLTPWETIARRLDAAARADFVIVLYNPKSKRRPEHLEQAQQIILAHRDGATPVGIVRRAMREGQRVTRTTLAELHRAEVDMQTTVFIGSSASVVYRDFLYTPRGYARKYRMDGP